MRYSDQTSDVPLSEPTLQEVLIPYWFIVPLVLALAVLIKTLCRPSGSIVKVSNSGSFASRLSRRRKTASSDQPWWS